MLNVKQESCEYQFFIVFGLNQLGMEPESAASVADALSTQRKHVVTIHVEKNLSQ